MLTVAACLLVTLAASPMPAVSPSPAVEEPHVEYWIGAVRAHPLQLVRKNAARILGTLGNSAAVPSLIEALRDSYSGVREEAARSLGLLGNEQALTPLAETYQRDSDALVRKTARDAMERIRARQEFLRKKEEEAHADAKPAEKK